MKPIRVLQFSTHNEDCGIAKYQEQFVAELINEEGFYTEFFEYSPNVIKKMTKSEQASVMRDLRKKLTDFDILHIQHEYSFFNRTELAAAIRTAKNLGKKVIVTVHTAPEAQYKQPVLRGPGPGSLKLYVRENITAKRFKKKYTDPLKDADLVIVHNRVTARSLVKFGVNEKNIRVIRIPVPKAKTSGTSTEIKEALRVKSGDIVFATIGFLSEAKGILHAVRALHYLPENYKLAIIGGIHPQGGNEKFLDKVTDTVYELGYKDRVYITGFIENDEKLDAMIRECDICVYPFDKKYYTYVSSASLNNSIANHKPIITYHTDPFGEVNEEIPLISFAKSPNYYELARAIENIDMERGQELSKEYAEKHSYVREAKNFYEIYKSVQATRR